VTQDEHNEALDAAAAAMADVHDMDVPWRTYAEAAIGAYLKARKTSEVTLSAASTRYMAAVKSLGERVPGKSYTYFEANFRDDDGCIERWRELNDAGVELNDALAEGQRI